jgi:hypothetical protein
MSAAKEVTVTFNLKPVTKFKLTVNKTGTGTGTVTSSPAGISCTPPCSAEFESGKEVTLTAAAAVGSEFVSWSGCASQPEPGKCKVTMSAAKEVTVTFNLKPVGISYTLQIKKEGTGTGTVTSKPAGIDCGSICSGKFPAKSVVMLTAVPTGESVFKRWAGVSGPCAYEETCKTTMGKDKVVKAIFTAVGNRALSVVKAGTGTGKVTSSPAGVDCGATCSFEFAVLSRITLTATPDAGSSFSGWSGPCAGTGPCEVKLTEAMSVTAAFASSSPPPPSQNGRAVVGSIVQIKKGKALVRVFCNGPASCKGSLTLVISGKLGKKTKKVTAGHGSFSLAAGGSKNVQVKLNGQAEKLLRKGTRLKGRVVGSKVHSRSVQLKQKRKNR